MKHLLGWKIFENGETYSSVPLHSLYAGFFFGDDDNAVDNIKDFKISDSTIGKILDEFPNLRVGESNPLFTHRSSCTTFWDNNFDIDIYEISGEWFYVEVHFRLGSGTYAFKCDQLDGLFDCIRNIYSSWS